MTIWGRQLKGCLILVALSLVLCGCTSTGGGQGVLFQDSFDDPGSGWGIERQPAFERGYDSGSYFFQFQVPHWFTWTTPDRNFGDVIVEVDAQSTSSSPAGHFGLLCRHTNANNFYYFAISADGYYGIFRRVDGGTPEIITGNGQGMAFSPAIKTGGQVNSIMAVCRADQLTLYANGELLESVTDATLTKGDVGLGAGSDETGNIRIQFDNLLVTRP